MERTIAILQRERRYQLRDTITAKTMLERFNALVHLIYEGATDISAWTRIVPALANHLDAEKGLLLTPFDAPDKGGFIFPHGIGQQHIELWKSRYLPEDLWARRMVERNLFYEGNVILGRDIATDEELRASTWYREFLVEMDIFQFITGIVFEHGRLDVPSTGCPFYRGVNAPPFDEEHRARLRLLMPHISRSLGVMFKLRDAEFRIAASLQALDRVRQESFCWMSEGASASRTPLRNKSSGKRTV